MIPVIYDPSGSGIQIPGSEHITAAKRSLLRNSMTDQQPIIRQRLAHQCSVTFGTKSVSTASLFQCCIPSPKSKICLAGEFVQPRKLVDSGFQQGLQNCYLNPKTLC